MRERPILFAEPMVRAILSGQKMVTRRAIKPQPKVTEAYLREHEAWVEGLTLSDHVNNAWQSGFIDVACPYGEPGDRLWVRESWWQAGDWQSTYPEDDTGAWFGSKRIAYSADSTPPNEPNRHYPAGLRNGAYSAAEPNKIWRHRPSIHMPRWASRILLEITAVRVERVQDISDEQALAEGVDQTNTSIPGYARQRFQDLWESINGTGSWDANPWVWVVEFKRITP